jgi:hypothetical protein
LVGPVTTAARSAGSADYIGAVSEPPPPPPPPGYGQQPPPYGYQYGYYAPQGYWQPPPQIDSRDLRPHWVWYLLSAIPLAIGLIVAVVFVVQFIDELDPDIDNFRSNRAALVDLQSGDRALYIQTRNAGVPLRLPPDDLRCNVAFIGADSPQPVPLNQSGGSTLDVNDDSYSEEFSFKAPESGRYRVSCEGPEGVRLAIGPDLSFGLFASLAIAILSLIVGGILTVVGLVVTAVRRSNHKQRLQREAREAQAAGRA